MAPRKRAPLLTQIVTRPLGFFCRGPRGLPTALSPSLALTPLLHPFTPTQRESFEGTLLNFRKDGSPVMNHLHITPLYSDPRRPTLATHYAGVICLRPADLNLGPLPLKPSRWLPDTLAGSQASLPVPASWAAGTQERDTKDWFADMGDREVSHLLGFLNLKGVAAMATTCRRMRRLAGGDPVWRSVCTRLWQPAAVASLERQARVLGWKRVAREIYTLEALHWLRRRVGGAVTPVRTNFSTCGLGDRVFVFGGEGADATAYNDLFVLDLGIADPTWLRVAFPPDALRPRGRWGHTLRELGSHALVLFGGSSADGPVNDVFVLDASTWQWREVHCSPDPQPVPRSWHGACTLGGRDLIIFGGCSAGGKLLSDTWRLNLDTSFPQWEQLSIGWTPPARLGLSLVATEEGRVFAFGGLASAGPVRLRSQDAFTMDLRAPMPTWHYVTGSQLPSGAAAAGTPPPPRLEQVAGTLIGGRVLVFGGSVNGGSDAAVTRAWEPYVMSPNSETPTWLRLRVTGSGPRDAWGYSTCMLGTHRFILAGKYDAGVLDMNELHELSLLSDPPAWEAAADDSRGSNTAHEKVVLTAATDAGEPSGLGDLRYGDAGGGKGDYDDDGQPGDASPGEDGEDGDSGQRSVRDEERSLAQPGEAQMQSGFGGAALWGDGPSTSGGDSPGSIPVRPRVDAAQAAPQQQQHQDGEESKQAHGARGQWGAQAPQQEEQSQREGTFPGLLPSALFPVLPLMASGARLLTQLQSAVVGGGGGSQATAPQQPPQTAGLTHLFAGAHGAQLPTHGQHRLVLVEPGQAAFLPHGDLTVDEERQRRRRSLTGRGLEHPRPNHSSGSDEEPSAKRGGLEEEEPLS